jgi:hypothetical protein
MDEDIDRNDNVTTIIMERIKTTNVAAVAAGIQDGILLVYKLLYIDRL